MSAVRSAVRRSISLKSSLYLATALTAALPAAAADVNFTTSNSTTTFFQLSGGSTADVAQGVTLSGGPQYTLFATSNAFSITNAGTVSSSSSFSTTNFQNVGITVAVFSPVTGNFIPVLGGSAGIRLDAGGSVTNSSAGTISGSVAGVFLNSTSTPGTVVNSGTIRFTNTATTTIPSVNGYGVLMTGGGTVTNTGYIGSTAATGASVVATNSALTLTNSGTLDGLVGAGAGGSITNNQGGKITYNGAANGSTGSPLAAVGGGGTSLTITNSGTIQGKNGVLANAGATVTNTQTGTISVTNNTDGDALILRGGTSTVSNDGTISGNIDISQLVGTTIASGVGDFRLTNGSTGVITGRVEMSGGTGNIVSNSGRITGNIVLGQDSPDPDPPQPNQTRVIAPVKTLTNASTGTISGTVLLGGGNVLNINVNGTNVPFDVFSSGTLTNAGTINGTVVADSVTNTGTIKVAAGTIALISYGHPGSNGYANLSGTFVNSGTVTGNVSVQSITNSGTINGDLLYGTDNGYTLPTEQNAIIGGVQTMRSVVATTLVNSGTVNGRITMANGSINNTGAIGFGTAFSTSTITGSFTQSATGKLTFKINDSGQSDKLIINGPATIAGTFGIAAVDGSWNADRQYTVLTATGGLTGTFSNIDINVAYLTPSLSYTANDVILAIARRTADIQENVVTETTAQQVSTSARRVAQAVDARVDEAISAAFIALPSLEQKTSSLPGLISGVNAGDTTNAMWGTWATFTPTFQKQALLLPGQSTPQSVTGTSLSFLAGLDRIVGSRTVVGAFFSYEDSDFDLTGTNGKRSGHGPVIGAYAGMVLTDWLNASAQVNHGWFQNKLAEGAFGVAPVTGSFDSNRIMTSETLTAHKVYDKFFNDHDVNLSAKVGYSFTRETFDSYTASDGAPVSPGATRLGRIVVGGEAAGWGTAFTPYLQVTYEWDVQTSGSAGDKSGAVVGIGGRYRLGNMSFDLYGSTQVGRRQERSKSVGVNARYAF